MMFQCLETRLLQQKCRGAIPGVWHDEPALPFVKGAEAFVELRLFHSVYRIID